MSPRVVQATRLSRSATRRAEGARAVSSRITAPFAYARRFLAIGGSPTTSSELPKPPFKRDAARQTLSALFLAGLFVALTGCSTFTREWKQAAGQPTPTDDITGLWQGSWKSDATGHHGKLRCVVGKESPNGYRFLYRATWKKIFRATYEVVQDVQREGNLFTMRGGADLGKLYGGQFEYEGRATPTNFFSTYRSQKDRGTFEMTRPRQ